jgi:signal transduction histidine kinase
LPRHAIEWISAIERGLTVDADPDQLFRVLLNLVRNAAQALESDKSKIATAKQIRITGRREGAVTILEISDTGPGIPEKAKAHLFEAFQGSPGRRHRPWPRHCGRTGPCPWRRR